MRSVRWLPVASVLLTLVGLLLCALGVAQRDWFLVADGAASLLAAVVLAILTLAEAG